MGAPYLTYTLLMLTSFHSGHREMVTFPGHTQEVCERQATEYNMAWKLYGDHNTFKSIKYLCLPSRKLP